MEFRSTAFFQRLFPSLRIFAFVFITCQNDDSSSDVFHLMEIFFPFQLSWKEVETNSTFWGNPNLWTSFSLPLQLFSFFSTESFSTDSALSQLLVLLLLLPPLAISICRPLAKSSRNGPWSNRQKKGKEEEAADGASSRLLLLFVFLRSTGPANQMTVKCIEKERQLLNALHRNPTQVSLPVSVTF